MRKPKLFWILVFSFLLFLTQATQFIHFTNSLILFGWPLWLFYLVGLQVIIVIALFFFSRHFLKEEE